MDDAISVRSYASSRMSGASNLSKRTGQQIIHNDAASVAASDLETVSRPGTIDNLS